MSGSFISIAGHNGSGKSTLLRIIANISAVTRGEVERAVQWSRLRLAYLPQHGGVYPYLTVAENLRLRARLFDRRVNVQESEYVRDLNLGDLLGVRVGKLSGGYERLCAMAALFIVEPDVLLLDEPFAGLDPVHGEHLMRILTRVHSRLKLIVITDHGESYPFPEIERVWLRPEEQP